MSWAAAIAAGGRPTHTHTGFWWDFSHPQARKTWTTESQKCDCDPVYHAAIDVTCHIDSGGHLRVVVPPAARDDDELEDEQVDALVVRALRQLVAAPR